MKILLVIFLGGSVFLTHSAPPPEKKCRLIWSDLNRVEIKQINVCVKELGYKTGGEKTKKSTCTMKCVLQKEHLIDASGQLSFPVFNSYIADHFPPSLIERANSTFHPCILLFDGKTIDQNDEFCKAYDPLIKCFTRNFANLCRGLP